MAHHFMKHLSLAICLMALSGCATALPEQAMTPAQAIPVLHGSYHQVRPGETLWRIARCYGLDVDRLAKANRLPSAEQLRIGQRLFVPLPNDDSAQFFWPLLGALGPSSRGIAISAPPGSLVRAARRGRVAVATRQLTGWGKTIVVDHLDGYLTVYAGLERLLVTPGVEMRQGAPIGTIGSVPLHFEIRHGNTSKDALALLPSHDADQPTP